MTARTLVHGVLLCVGIASLCGNSFAGSAKTPLYLDPAQPTDVRIDDLLSRMTLAEKIGQINMPCVYEGRLGRDVRSKMEGCRKFTLGQSELPSDRAAVSSRGRTRFFSKARASRRNSSTISSNWQSNKPDWVFHCCKRRKAPTV